MSDDRVRTFVKIRGREAMPFQEYFVKGRARGFVERDRTARYRGCASPALGPRCDSRLRPPSILAPSNPFVSLGPIFGLRGVREALASARDRVVAISPIVGGKTIKGPADKMLRGLGLKYRRSESRASIRISSGLFVLDKVDRRYIEPIRELGMRAVAADTIMTHPGAARRRLTQEDSSRLS